VGRRNYWQSAVGVRIDDYEPLQIGELLMNRKIGSDERQRWCPRGSDSHHTIAERLHQIDQLIDPMVASSDFNQAIFHHQLL
jgi:hypothetical protein